MRRATRRTRWRRCAISSICPPASIYLDGNSLGVLPAPRLRGAAVVAEEWGRDLIRSWNSAGWIDLPQRLGDKIARLVGAGPGEVVAADSTSINLFKVLAARWRCAGRRAAAPRDRVGAQQLPDRPLHRRQRWRASAGFELALVDDARDRARS